MALFFLVRVPEGNCRPRPWLPRSELEQIRQSLYKTITLLQDRVARYSQGLEKDDDPERRFWMQSPPSGGNSLAELSAMDERRSEVMNIAQQACKEYDQLVLTARRKASI